MMSKCKNSDSTKSKCSDFEASLNEVFDISHENALDMISDEGDLRFLIHIRKTKTSGVLEEVNASLHKELRAAKRVLGHEQRVLKEHRRVEAPANYLSLLKELESYKVIDADVSTANLQKFITHLWYLNEKNVCMTLFDDTLSHNERASLARANLTSTVSYSKAKTNRPAV